MAAISIVKVLQSRLSAHLLTFFIMALDPQQVATALQLATSSLRFLLCDSGLSDQTQARLYMAGFSDLRLFGRIAEDVDDLKAVLLSDFGLNVQSSLASRVEVAKFIGAWQSARDQVSKEDEARSDARLSRLPRPVPASEYAAMRLAYETAYDRLQPHLTPSRHFMGVKLEQVEDNEPRVELLRDVTSRDDAEASFLGADVDERGVLRVKRASASGARPPRDPEELRIRHRVLGNAWVFCHFKHGTRTWLVDMNPDVLPRFSDYILGKHVAGLRVKSGGKGETNPAWQLVLSFEFECRKWVYEQILDGSSLKAAFRDVEKNSDLRERFLVTPLALNQDNRLNTTGGASARDQSSEGKGKGKKGRYAQGGKGKKGKGKKGTTPDGKKICWAYNSSQGCQREKCDFLHVCNLCFGKHEGNCPKARR